MKAGYFVGWRYSTSPTVRLGSKRVIVGRAYVAYRDAG
jgi:hypothetical protein